MSEQQKKMNDLSSSKDLSKSLNEPQNEMDYVKYFSVNGFKECKLLESTENSSKNSIKAWDIKNKNYVVIKVIQTLNPQETALKIQEIQKTEGKFLQKYITMPTVLQDNYIYYTREFQKNGNLRDLCLKMKLNIDYAQRFICKILIGLNQIHQKNLFHGRIKLENILVDNKESILLTDYCIGEEDGFFLDEKKEIQLDHQVLQLQQGQIEQKQNQDLYRVGVIIHYLCDILKEKDKDFLEKLKYNTKRSYKLLSIARQFMEQDNKQKYAIDAILDSLGYFEGSLQSKFFGLENYEGETKNNKRHGKGVNKYPNGNIVFGYWENDKYTKKGVIYYQNGDILDRGYTDPDINNSLLIWKKQQAIYEGELKDLYVNGYGMYTINGIEQVGNYTYGRINGYGEVYYQNKDIYKGNFVNHKKNGYGEMFWSIGQVYKGDFYQDQIIGKGSYEFPDGSEYCGEIKNGFFNGYGKLYWHSGCYYEGQWVMHKKEGFGLYYTKYNDQLYEGYFKNNMMNGKGKITNSDGSIKIGVWKDDQYLENSEIEVNLENFNEIIKEKRISNKREEKQQQCSIF